MASRLEECIAEGLRHLLAPLAVGDQIEQSPSLQRILNDLEWYLPPIVCEANPDFDRSLDGILAICAMKTGDDEAKLVGQCIFIEDQTVTPIYVQLQIGPEGREIAWLECRIGQSINGVLKTVPYSVGWPIGKLLAISEEIDSIEWCYHVGFGQGRPS